MNKNTFTAFGLECPPGQAISSLVPVGELNIGVPVSLPVRIINGASDGPVLGMCAMVHGDEYNGYAAINELFDSIDPQELSGALIGVPVANPFALLTNRRISDLEYERLNLNRVFPGTPGGFQMERVANQIFEEAIVRSDVWMDFHEGGRDFIARYLIVGVEEGMEQHLNRDLQLARWFGQGIPITVTKLDAASRRLGRGGASTVQAAMMGKGSLGIELGGGGVLHPEFVAQAVEGTRRVMVGLGMIDGEIPEDVEQTVSYSTAWPRPNKGGFFEQCVFLGQIVEEGEVVGWIRDLFGQKVEEIRAPFRAVITDTRHTATIQTGEWTVKCARLDD